MDRIEAAIYDLPIITRSWAAIIVAVSFLCHIDVLSPYQLFFDWNFILRGRQYWRLVSSFFYFGSFGIDFFFHMFFLVRYCQLLEEGSFLNKPADFFLLLAYSAVAIIGLATLLPTHTLAFLGTPLTFVIVYIWARRNPFIRMNFLGVLNFQAPFLPWVLVAFSALMHGIPTTDLIGILVGHVYWYCEDIYPRMLDARGLPRRRIFAPPQFLMDFFGQPGPEIAQDIVNPELPVPEGEQEPEAAQPLAPAQA